jgi:hypothetical protein
VAEKVPAAQGATATQESDVAFHAKPVLHAHLGCPTSALDTLYSAVAGHARQLVSPSSEKVCAGHAPQTMLAAAEHVEEPS